MIELTSDEFEALLVRMFDAWPEPREDEGWFQWLFAAERSMVQKIADLSMPGYLPDNVRKVHRLKPTPTQPTDRRPNG